MKKLVCMCVSLTLAASLSACGAKEESGKMEEQEVMKSEISAEVEMVATESLYGKVTSVVGNEIELALAKAPEIPEMGESGQEVKVEEGMVAAVVLSAVAIETGAEAEENMEFTGESMTITIPTGTKIYQAGQESTVNSIQKGSIVTMNVDNLDDMNIERLDILS